MEKGTRMFLEALRQVTDAIAKKFRSGGGTPTPAETDLLLQEREILYGEFDSTPTPTPEQKED